MEKWVDVKRIGEKSGAPDSDNEYKIFVGGIAKESTEVSYAPDLSSQSEKTKMQQVND